MQVTRSGRFVRGWIQGIKIKSLKILALTTSL